LSGTKYRVSAEGVSLMDEANNLAKRVVHKTKQDNLKQVRNYLICRSFLLYLTTDHSTSAFVQYAGYSP